MVRHVSWAACSNPAWSQKHYPSFFQTIQSNWKEGFSDIWGIVHAVLSLNWLELESQKQSHTQPLPHPLMVCISREAGELTSTSAEQNAVCGFITFINSYRESICLHKWSQCKAVSPANKTGINSFDLLHSAHDIQTALPRRGGSIWSLYELHCAVQLWV